jgi:hypothetical protein
MTKGCGWSYFKTFCKKNNNKLGFWFPSLSKLFFSAVLCFIFQEATTITLHVVMTGTNNIHDWDKCYMLGDGVLQLQTIANQKSSGQLLDCNRCRCSCNTMIWSKGHQKCLCEISDIHNTCDCCRWILIVLATFHIWLLLSAEIQNNVFFYLPLLSEQILCVYKVLKIILIASRDKSYAPQGKTVIAKKRCISSCIRLICDVQWSLMFEQANIFKNSLIIHSSENIKLMLHTICIIYN